MTTKVVGKNYLRVVEIKLQNKTLLWVVVIAQQVTCFSKKHEDERDLQNPHENLGMMVCDCSPSPGEIETGGFLGAYSPDNLA